jgi:tetratricopeptide (TPR) repeat protein
MGSLGRHLKVVLPSRTYNFYVIFLRAERQRLFTRGKPMEAILQLAARSLNDFAGAQAEFNRLAAPVKEQLEAERAAEEAQKAKVSEVVLAEVSAADAAAAQGRAREALDRYRAALVQLPAWAAAEQEQRLRERIVQIVRQLDPPPTIPEDANRHAAYAMTAFEDAKAPEDFDKAIAEWKEALGAAPWWAEAYFNLALVLEKRELYAEAARNLQLYLLAKPDAEDAPVVQQKIYSLEYKAKQQAE